MKTNAFLFLACVTTTFFFADLANVQTSPPGPQVGGLLPPPGGAEMLLRTLQLTDVQKAQVKPYFDAVLTQIIAAREQERQTETALITQLSAQIRPFLNTEQQTQLDALQVLQAPLGR